jgi:sulfatase modifying factor 1
VLEPFASRHGRWSPLAVALLAIAACGGRTSGTSPAASCNDNGTAHTNGTYWPCSDGCNSCSCENGQIGSTLVGCLHPEAGALSDAGGAGVDTGLDAATGAEAEATDDATDAATTDVDANGSAVGAGGDMGPVAGVDAALPPSCAPGGPGMTNCGPGGSGTESCCASSEVEGGTYYRTYTNTGGGATGEADPATVSGFRMDKYLVTVGRFRQFVNVVLPPDGATGWLPSPGSGKHAYLNGGQGLANSASPGTYEPGWVALDDDNIAPTDANLVAACDEPNYATWTATAGSQESLPINCVNWWESYAFCIWDGGLLPSEAEWEYAAAGGSQQREYPWGVTAPGTGNQYAIYGDGDGHCYYPNGPLTPCTGLANIAPVGTATLGSGLWGQLDLAGDVLEWNLDLWSNPYVDPCTDCSDVTADSDRVIRGGLFEWGAPSFLPTTRGGGSPSGRAIEVGLRCARTP